MPQLFRPRSNALVVVALVGAVAFLATFAVVAIALYSSPYVTGAGNTPEQPVAFSHKHHVGGLGIDCRYCHTAAEKSSFAGVPPTHTCMTCHSQEWTQARMLEPVRRSLRRDVPLRWVRVNDLADFVYFSHRMHVNNGVGCESCHGRVDRMPITSQAKPLTMQWCLSCHREPKQHLRPPDEITTMGYKPHRDEETGQELMEQYDIHPRELTECVTCHR